MGPHSRARRPGRGGRMAEQQRLNSLDRFRKQPGRLVLEEYSHCEVPAGCGGVVLRWRSPAAAVPVTVHLYTPAPATCRIDGAELQTGRVELAPGPHAVALTLEQVDLLADYLLLFAAVHDPKERQTRPADVSERPMKVLTAADGTWRFRLDPPASDAWTAADFDDRDWPALVKGATPGKGSPDAGTYQLARCVRLGAVGLRVPPPADAAKRPPWWKQLLGLADVQTSPPVMGSIRIRKVFT